MEFVDDDGVQEIWKFLDGVQEIWKFNGGGNNVIGVENPNKLMEQGINGAVKGIWKSTTRENDVQWRNEGLEILMEQKTFAWESIRKGDSVGCDGEVYQMRRYYQ